jgi:hypothetical protein
LQLEAQLNDEQGMLEQKAAQVTGEEQAFTDAHEKGFEVGAFRMSRPSPRRTLVLPVLNQGPIE